MEEPRNKDTSSKPSAPAQPESLGKAERLGKGGVRCGHKMDGGKRNMSRKLKSLEYMVSNIDQALVKEHYVYFFQLILTTNL